MLASHNILSPASGQPITVPTQDLVLGIYYLTKAKVNAKGEGRVFANIEEVLMALEAKQVETLTPIRLRYTGPVLDMTTAYDDQDLNHTEPVEFHKQFISTTVGRAILNDALPEGMPYVNGLLKKKGIGQLVNYCYLNLGLESRSRRWTRSRTWASATPPSPASPLASTTWSSPTPSTPSWATPRSRSSDAAAVS